MLSHMNGSTWITAVWSPATLVKVRSLCPVVGRPLESVARRPTSAQFPRSRVSRSCSDVFSSGIVILVLRLCQKRNNHYASFINYCFYIYFIYMMMLKPNASYICLKKNIMSKYKLNMVPYICIFCSCIYLGFCDFILQ